MRTRVRAQHVNVVDVERFRWQATDVVFRNKEVIEALFGRYYGRKVVVKLPVTRKMSEYGIFDYLKRVIRHVKKSMTHLCRDVLGHVV